MPCLSQPVTDIRRSGPLIEVFIGVSDPVYKLLQEQGQKAPDPLKAYALIDTGASATTIDPEIAESLSLTPRGVINISTPSCASHPANTYDVSVYFPAHKYPLPLLTVIEGPLAAQGIHCLIGRDILSNGLLVYEGYADRFILSF